ncbi:MAG: DUF3021 domain-containing protein [Lachnospiraceae bacterium]|nr:DUF3021 domain-containing protein [Lachnospiraceae bacterium]
MGLGNKFLVKTLIGIVLGMIIGIAFWMGFGNDHGSSGNAALILHLLISGLFGAISMGGSVVYEIESWSLLKATLSHYFACMSAFTVSSLLLGWFPDLSGFAVMLLIMTVLYACIWIGESVYWKRTINRINEQLNDIADEAVLQNRDQ